MTASLRTSAGDGQLFSLAPTTFYHRHRWRATLLIGATGLMNLAVVLFISALAVNADAQKPFLGYLSRVSLVRVTDIIQSRAPGVLALVERHPAVEQVIRVAPRYHMPSVKIPPFASAEASPLGVSAKDRAYLVEPYGLERKEGHMPRPGTNQMVIPGALTQNRDLEVGDLVGNPERPVYPGAPSLDTESVISDIFAQPRDP